MDCKTCEDQNRPALKMVNTVALSITIIIVILLFFIIIKVYSMIAYHEGNKIVFKGKYYREYYGHFEASDKLIGYIKFPIDGIYALKNDETNNYLYVTQFTDQDLYIKEGLDVPKSGEVTMAIVNYHTDKAISSKKDIELILSLERQKGELFYKIDIPNYPNNIPHSSSIYYCYNNCPVSDYLAGEIWYVGEKWIYFPGSKLYEGVVITEITIVQKLNNIFYEVYRNAKYVQS